jgi:hypothetical protein
VDVAAAGEGVWHVAESRAGVAVVASRPGVGGQPDEVVTSDGDVIRLSDDVSLLLGRWSTDVGRR